MPPHAQDVRHLIGFVCHIRTCLFVYVIQIQACVFHIVHYGGIMPSARTTLNCSI